MTDNVVGDPTYPHVSVLFKQGTASSNHAFEIGFAYLPSELANTHVHNIKITYQRQINKLDFRQENFKVIYSASKVFQV